MTDTQFLLILAAVAVIGVPLVVVLALLVDEGVYRLRRRERHPMQTTFRPVTTAQGEPEVTPVLDWDTAMDRELAAAVPIPPLEPVPAPKPVMQECAVCGRAFKPRGLPIHTARVHKTPARSTVASSPQRDGVAPGGTHTEVEVSHG